LAGYFQHGQVIGALWPEQILVIHGDDNRAIFEGIEHHLRGKRARRNVIVRVNPFPCHHFKARINPRRQIRRRDDVAPPHLGAEHRAVYIPLRLKTPRERFSHGDGRRGDVIRLVGVSNMCDKGLLGRWRKGRDG